MREIVKVENGIIQVAEEAMNLLHDFQVKKAEMEMQEKEFKQAILTAMEENGIKSFENDFVKITFVPTSTRDSVDTKALKEDGLYDLYKKTSIVASQVRLTWK